MKSRLWLVSLLTIVLVTVVVAALVYGDHKMEFLDAEDYPSVLLVNPDGDTIVKAWEDPDTEIVHYFIPGGVKSSIIFRGEVSRDDLQFSKELNRGFFFSYEKSVTTKNSH